MSLALVSLPFPDRSVGVEAEWGVWDSHLGGQMPE